MFLPRARMRRVASVKVRPARDQVHVGFDQRRVDGADDLHRALNGFLGLHELAEACVRQCLQRISGGLHLMIVVANRQRDDAGQLVDGRAGVQSEFDVGSQVAWHNRQLLVT